MTTHRLGNVFVRALQIVCLASLVLFAPRAAAAAETVETIAVVETGVISGNTTQDLGQGLAYFRVTNLTEQLPAIHTALAANPALVLDLRGVSANIATAQALRSALIPTSTKARVVRLVLINAATTSSIPFSLGTGLPENGIPGVLTIALEAAKVPADIKIPGSIDDDRRACEAIAAGAALGTLINHQPTKDRYDEAVLVRDHSGLAAPEVHENAEKTDENNDGGAAGKDGRNDAQKTPASPPPPLTDSVLQAAVQVHRSMVALKKL